MTSLYRTVIGQRFDVLPAAVRELHNHETSVVYRGQGSVERGSGLLSRLVGAMMQFPPAMNETAVSVNLDIRDGAEIWTRDFGGHRFSSRLSKQGEHLAESFVAIRVRFQLEATAAGINMIAVRWSVLAIPLPRFLWPRIIAREYEQDGRFHFFVESKMPLAGFVVRYRGWLALA
ncbi:MAG: DUF4166 domain-containing protein [Betaproteobacteria bacterium]|nr:DUF4166 domain-containing protein [Betaproteobacteria bacterium]